ncbi:MAG: DUF2993 domain-containing protein [Cyanobacteria bacterium P01_H01_bin.130]
MAMAKNSELDLGPVGRAGDTETVPLKSGRVARLLGAAVRFWLKTQLDRVEALDVTVGGSTRELLSGCLPGVTVRATGVVYQGLALQDAAIAASQIRVNLSQVLRGKPLQLLEPIAIELVQRVTAENLNQSLTAPLLAQAIADFVRPLLAKSDTATFTPERLTLGDQCLILQGDWGDRAVDSAQTYPLTLTTGLTLSGPQTLHFQDPRWTWAADAPRELPPVSSFDLELGSDVAFRTLAIAPDGIRCEGTLMVRP